MESNCQQEINTVRMFFLDHCTMRSALSERLHRELSVAKYASQLSVFGQSRCDDMKKLVELKKHKMAKFPPGEDELLNELVSCHPTLWCMANYLSKLSKLSK